MSASVVTGALRVKTFTIRLLVELTKYIVVQLFFCCLFFFLFQKMAQDGQKHPKYSKYFYFLRASCLYMLLYSRGQTVCKIKDEIVVELLK